MLPMTGRLFSSSCLDLEGRCSVGINKAPPDAYALVGGGGEADIQRPAEAEGVEPGEVTWQMLLTTAGGVGKPTACMTAALGRWLNQ